MTLQVIKAEDVRDGEPRIWLAHRQDMPHATTRTMHTSSRRDAGCQSCEFAIVDRPAPSTQPPQVLDLDALAEAERAMTAGAWTAKGCSFQHGIVQRSGNGAAHGFQDDPPCSFDQGVANAAGIVALRNAAPHLIAEARAAVALRQELAAMAEKLAEAKRLGLEACDAGSPFDTAAIRAALEAL